MSNEKSKPNIFIHKALQSDSDEVSKFEEESNLLTKKVLNFNQRRLSSFSKMKSNSVFDEAENDPTGAETKENNEK